MTVWVQWDPYIVLNRTSTPSVRNRSRIWIPWVRSGGTIFLFTYDESSRRIQDEDFYPGGFTYVRKPAYRLSTGCNGSRRFCETGHASRLLRQGSTVTLPGFVTSGGALLFNPLALLSRTQQVYLSFRFELRKLQIELSFIQNRLAPGQNVGNESERDRHSPSGTLTSATRA